MNLNFNLDATYLFFKIKLSEKDKNHSKNTIQKHPQLLKMNY